MLIDLNTLDTRELQTGICIVGAGAAGITLALTLAQHGHDVLLLESGGNDEEETTQNLYAGTVADEKMHSPPDTYRQRRLGGTSTIWGGRCMPYDPIDFESRDYLPHSGWPIAYSSLLPFYPDANRWCEAGNFDYSAHSTFGDAAKPMIAGFDSAHFSTDPLERFSCPTNFAARYGHKLTAAKNLTVLLHANVTDITLSDNRVQVTQVTARTLDGTTAGKSVVIRAKHFVLATGGIETPRLLLANRQQMPNGLGNQHDVVGRYYMCHIAGTIGTIRLKRPITDIWHGYQVSPEGIYCRRRLALLPEVQRQQGLGNFVARLHHPRITLPEHRNAMLSMLYLAKPVIPYEYAKRLHGEEPATLKLWLQHALNVCRDPFDAFGFAWHMLRDRKLAERKFPSIIFHPKAAVFSLDFHAEQQPLPESRIQLGQERDALGMPRVHVDWRYAPSDVHTVKQSLALLAQDLAQSGMGHFEYDPDSVEHEMTRYGAYGGHHIGTTRMGLSAKESVVDSNCKLHDIHNLFIASAAVLPTSSQANPTLTVVALALRLAEHLRGLSA